METRARRRASLTPGKQVTLDKKNAPPADKHEYEFGGPVGASGVMLLLPSTVFLCYFGASRAYKFNVVNGLEVFEQLPENWSEVWDWTAAGVVLAWFAFNVLLERCLFHTKVKGVELRTGERLTYRISGHLHFWVALLVLGHCYPVWGAEGQFLGLTHFPLAWLYDHYLQLATAAMTFSTLLAAWLYARSFAAGALLAAGGDSGNVVYNFFIGRELNPRTGSFDWKEFCELRPGLIGWAVLNLACLTKQHQTLGLVTVPMLLVNAFQGLYVFDALYHERAILTTMDITTDGFGFMLAFGDLAWVPFTYSLQARYLVENSPELPTWLLVLICGLNMAGYFIFRGSNSEKDAFRSDPKSDEVMHLRTLQTRTGRKLLVSGWWGLARKINYFGDWCMGLSWCLLTGFECPLTYFYCIYFFVLLVHRALRDDHACGSKYGADWVKYKESVPWLFFPGLY